MNTVPQASAPTTRKRMRWPLLAGAVVLLLALGAWQREQLWVWYCAERLERAAESDCATWANHMRRSGETAVPTLMAMLRHDQPAVCQAAAASLIELLHEWPENDPRKVEFGRRFALNEPRFSTPGRSAAIAIIPEMIQHKTPGAIDQAKAMLTAAVKSESMPLRLQAVALAMRPEVALLEPLVPLLDDDAAEVRRAALLALGPPAPDDQRPIVEDDQLLKWLNDPDTEVRRLCEMSLRGRGRTSHDIRMGRRFTSRNPSERQQLLIDLADEEDMDITAWLERLTADSDPAMRAGAARLVAERNIPLAERLETMGKSDPDPLVRRIANFYRQKMR